MATRRMILKNDFESPQWLKLSVQQRYLYMGLTLFADDDGILPVYLIQNRIMFFEYDGVTPEELQQDLSDLDIAGYIQIYESEDGDRYIQISMWWNKQFIDKKIYKQTTYPRPPNYMQRPENLTKHPNSSFYNSSSKPLEQRRVEQARGEQPISEKRSSTGNDDLPF